MPRVICYKSNTSRSRSDGSINENYLARHREFHMSILAPCGSLWLLELSEKIFDWTQRYQYQAMRAACGRLPGYCQ
jgi:DNA-binding GntR family transcriptional regulator